MLLLQQVQEELQTLWTRGNGRIGCHGYSLLGNTSYATLAASHAPDAPATRPVVRCVVPAISFSRIQCQPRGFLVTDRGSLFEALKVFLLKLQVLGASVEQKLTSIKSIKQVPFPKSLIVGFSNIITATNHADTAKITIIHMMTLKGFPQNSVIRQGPQSSFAVKAWRLSWPCASCGWRKWAYARRGWMVGTGSFVVKIWLERLWRDWVLFNRLLYCMYCTCFLNNVNRKHVYGLFLKGSAVIFFKRLRVQRGLWPATRYWEDQIITWNSNPINFHPHTQPGSVVYTESLFKMVSHAQQRERE